MAAQDGGPERLYVNLSMICATDNQTYPHATFLESRAASLLPKASYVMSVQRWSATGMALPLFIAPINVADGDIDQTQWEVAMNFARLAGAALRSRRCRA